MHTHRQAVVVEVLLAYRSTSSGSTKPRASQARAGSGSRD